MDAGRVGGHWGVLRHGRDLRPRPEEKKIIIPGPSSTAHPSDSFHPPTSKHQPTPTPKTRDISSARYSSIPGLVHTPPACTVRHCTHCLGLYSYGSSFTVDTKGILDQVPLRDTQRRLVLLPYGLITLLSTVLMTSPVKCRMPPLHPPTLTFVHSPPISPLGSPPPLPQLSFSTTTPCQPVDRRPSSPRQPRAARLHLRSLALPRFHCRRDPMSLSFLGWSPLSIHVCAVVP
jgi:hypothetical protein